MVVIFDNFSTYTSISSCESVLTLCNIHHTKCQPCLTVSVTRIFIVIIFFIMVLGTAIVPLLRRIGSLALLVGREARSEAFLDCGGGFS